MSLRSCSINKHYLFYPPSFQMISHSSPKILVFSTLFQTNLVFFAQGPHTIFRFLHLLSEPPRILPQSSQNLPCFLASFRVTSHSILRIPKRRFTFTPDSRAGHTPLPPPSQDLTFVVQHPVAMLFWTALKCRWPSP